MPVKRAKMAKEMHLDFFENICNLFNQDRNTMQCCLLCDRSKMGQYSGA